MSPLKCLSLLLLVTLVWMPYSEAYFLVIDAHAEECFFDRVTSGTKLGLTFEVVEGGFLDIDVSIAGMYKYYFNVSAKTIAIWVFGVWYRSRS